MLVLSDKYHLKIESHSSVGRKGSKGYPLFVKTRLLNGGKYVKYFDEPRKCDTFSMLAILVNQSPFAPQNGEKPTRR